MRIQILQFKVVQTYVMRDTVLNKIWKFITQNYEHDQYHFDLQLVVDQSYKLQANELQPNDVVILPNDVRLKIWYVDRFCVKAKTYKFVKADLRKYHPIEMYLVYPRIEKAV
jgi:hypothetical protein